MFDRRPECQVGRFASLETCSRHLSHLRAICLRFYSDWIRYLHLLLTRGAFDLSQHLDYFLHHFHCNTMHAHVASKGCLRVPLSWHQPLAQHPQRPSAVQTPRSGNPRAQAFLPKASQHRQQSLQISQDMHAEPAVAQHVQSSPLKRLRIPQACMLALLGMFSLAAFSNSALAASIASSGGFSIGGAVKGSPLPRSICLRDCVAGFREYLAVCPS